MSIEVEKSRTNKALDFTQKQHELLKKISKIINSKDFVELSKPDSVSTPIQELRTSTKQILGEFEGVLKTCSESKYKAWKAKNDDFPIVMG